MATRRKSKVTRLAPEHRAEVERMLREDRLTLDEMRAELRAKWPEAEQPSRSGLGRYKKHIDEMAGRMRDIQAASKALVTDLGEDPNDRAGQLMVEAITTLATHAALKANDADEENNLSVKEIGELGRTARAVMQARTMSQKERQQIEAAVREKIVREGKAKLDALGKAGDVSQETLRKVIQAAYGLGE